MTPQENKGCEVPNCKNERELYAVGDHDELSKYCAYHGETKEGQQEASHQQTADNTAQRIQMAHLLRPPKKEEPMLEFEQTAEWEDEAPMVFGRDLKENELNWLKIVLSKEYQRGYNIGHFDGHDVGLTDGLNGIEEKILEGKRAALEQAIEWCTQHCDADTTSCSVGLQEELKKLS